MEHRSVAKRSTEPHLEVHQRLMNDSRVRRAEQQRAKLRTKRDLIIKRPSNILTMLNDERWPQMWYLVSNFNQECVYLVYNYYSTPINKHACFYIVKVLMIKIKYTNRKFSKQYMLFGIKRIQLYIYRKHCEQYFQINGNLCSI